ncbi:uncharacterized protein DEA37_0004234 [Paragonimus westermani]|uniref:Uncharacterized protein n=1 Tax=Paragonimus westermani TaxID=34504 RepID=A0A5J4N711_9TREM|nr:uncharacterized protein DEA37_0004234 [Paragonimus westermani]
MTMLVPWYREQLNRSTCTINIGRQQTQVHYSILTTDDFNRKYDPSCVTYDILLASQVARTPAFENKYYLIYIKLENRKLCLHLIAWLHCLPIISNNVALIECTYFLIKK